MSIEQLPVLPDENIKGWRFEDSECVHRVPKSTVLIGTWYEKDGPREVRGKRCQNCGGLYY